MGFRLQSPTETRQAVLATDALNRSRVAVGDGPELAAADVWHRIYDVTAFLVGGADDLTFFEYQEAVDSAFGEGFDMAGLGAADNLAALVEELRKLRQPGILGGFLSAFLDETEYTQGWRFMGQRFVPDSYVLGQMVWPHVGPRLSDPAAEPYVAGCTEGQPTCDEVMADLETNNCICFSALQDGHPEICRVLPKGLDVMATLGSARARTLLEPDEEYCGLDARLTELTEEMAAYDRAAWRQNVYWTWLDVLKPLLEALPEGFPSWARTEAWQTRTLNTALTSWAELRHDTILYVKQSYTPMMAGEAGPPPPPEALGYVEPLPAFYARLRDLAHFTMVGLQRHGALPDGVRPHLERVVSLLDRLVEIASRELVGEDLTDGDIETIRTIGDRFSGIINGLAKAVTVPPDPNPECEEEPEWCHTTSEVVGDPYKTAIVADVHTDLNTKTVLEEGSGYLDLLIVAHELPDGTIGAAVGPVFSYYEFAHPYDDRLTDEAWKAMLDGAPPARPAWTSEYRAE